uniref:Fungal lipase-like domain-containing protein n=1 Tax=Acrobeloides nanus TaxID=290746 RepID=A0A914DCN8_9BILA
MVNCSSALGVSHDEEAIILAFRWTVGWGEVYEQSDYNKTVPFPGGGTVLSFYYNVFASVWYGGIRDAFFSVRNSYPTYEVWVTGWSLGAATATMGAAYLSQMGYVQPNNIKLMNFGSPRLGHPDFANRFPSLVPYAYRVVHNRDHVPHAPTPADGYQHIKNEVWYPNAMRDGDPYIECDTGESLNCSAQIQPSQYIPGNHATYFNITGYCQRSP